CRPRFVAGNFDPPEPPEPSSGKARSGMQAVKVFVQTHQNHSGLIAKRRDNLVWRIGSDRVSKIGHLVAPILEHAPDRIWDAVVQEEADRRPSGHWAALPSFRSWLRAASMSSTVSSGYSLIICCAV